MAQMQQIFYDQAPYDILYYDNNLDAYHTDKFAGWQNQPVEGGAPFFATARSTTPCSTDATQATPAPSASANPAPRPSGGRSARRPAWPRPRHRPTRAAAAARSPLIVGIIAIAVLLVVVHRMTRRRRAAAAEDDE